jgi:hypothetical protein
MIFWIKNLISAKEDMKIKKNAFSTLVLHFTSAAGCYKLKIQKIQKSAPPPLVGKVENPVTLSL